MPSTYNCVYSYCFNGSKAVDGLYEPRGVHEYTSIAQTNVESNPWIQIDLAQAFCISAVKIWNRYLSLAGKTILFTGTLQQMGRKEAQELAVKNGAKNISAVSRNLDILVAGEKAGSKLKKATALGSVQIMTEEEFLNLIR